MLHLTVGNVPTWTPGFSASVSKARSLERRLGIEEGALCVPASM